MDLFREVLWRKAGAFWVADSPRTALKYLLHDHIIHSKVFVLVNGKVFLVECEGIAHHYYLFRCVSFWMAMNQEIMREGKKYLFWGIEVLCFCFRRTIRCCFLKTNFQSVDQMHETSENNCEVSSCLLSKFQLVSGALSCVFSDSTATSPMIDGWIVSTS